MGSLEDPSNTPQMIVEKLLAEARLRAEEEIEARLRAEEDVERNKNK